MGNSDSFLFKAILLFYELQTPLQGWRLPARYLGVVGIAFLNLYSNLNGLPGGTAAAGRGTLVDETHLISPSVRGRFFWEKGR